MEVEQQQQQDDELEVGLIARRRNLHQIPLSTKINAEFNSNQGSSINGEEPKQQQEEDEVIKDFSRQNGIKFDEQEYCVYYDTDKGTGLHHESSSNGIDSTGDAKSPVQENTDVTSHNQENGNGEHHNISDGSLQPSEISFDKGSPLYINSNTESSDTEVIKDGVDEISEYDVETVLKKQDTHDLYCPNCNSCITKRVILRKRKRRIPAPGEGAKRNKPETSISSQVNVVSTNNQSENGADVQPPSSNEYDHQREPDVFRCLSCFSIFMPTGKGFKLFRMFGNKSEEEGSEKEAGVKKHRFSSIFTSDKVEQSNNQGAIQRENNVASDELNSNATMDLEDKGEPKGDILVKDHIQSPFSTQGSEQLIVEEEGNSNGRKSDTQDQLLTSYHIESNAKSDYPGMFVVMPPTNDNNNVEATDDKNYNDGLRLIVPPNVGSLIIDNSQMNQELGVTVQINTPGSDGKGRTNLSFSPPPSPSTNLTINGKELNMDKDAVAKERTVQNNVEIHLEEPLKDVLTDKQIKLVQDLKNNESIKGKDTIITIDNKQLEASGHQSSQGETGTPALQHVESGSQQGGATTPTGGGGSLDIVKSIVYGGLIESIASLSVVSSAAGADASTLNVLALGVANIFGGLFVISHDLWDLKNERPSGSSEDRYQQLLGQRGHFARHMAVSLFSYLVFGFLPPIVYGFSFRESNNKDLKLLMVAAVSVICIMMLAAGRAYVQNKSYFKTIAYYITFGFMVSGVSILFGGLITKLLEKIDILHAGSVVDLVSIHGMSSKPALTTY